MNWNMIADVFFLILATWSLLLALKSGIVVFPGEPNGFSRAKNPIGYFVGLGFWIIVMAMCLMGIAVERRILP